MQTDIGEVIDALSEIKERLIRIEDSVKDLDNDLHETKPEYIAKINEKLKENKGKIFSDKKEFLNCIKNEL